MRKLFFLLCLSLPLAGFAVPSTTMPRTSDIASTKHNLSVTGQGDIKASMEDEICVFCHTPHGATALEYRAPLWNRDVSEETYIPYDSDSIQANIDSNPGGSSRLCLSCHDGTLALGAVNVLNGERDVTIDVSVALGETPDDESPSSGFTRKLGVDLTNDHPISFDYDTSKAGAVRLAVADGELRDPIDADGQHIKIPSPGVHPILPLSYDGKVQCTTCHDPHVSGQDQPVGTSLLEPEADNIKFLRSRRFQMASPLGGNFAENTDIVCLGCHDKGQAWAESAHANPASADETYLNEAADRREFPQNIQVWQAACLNCHDTHTVQNASYLLREGIDAAGTPANEETCYQCHDADGSSLLNTVNEARDIKSEFTTMLYHMPITSVDQPAGTEVHAVTDANQTETRHKLGFNDLSNRHVECTDCHNPHRMIKDPLYNGPGGGEQGTHDHEAPHTNLISGALNGTFGVEPVYGSSVRRFGDPSALPTDFEIKSGLGANRVTKEYQVCLKCHSNYGFNDDGGPDNADGLNDNGRPETGGSGLTPYFAISTTVRERAETNSFRNYTNQAMQFQAPPNHASEPLNMGNDGGACGGAITPCTNGRNYNTNNHRSWHPVMAPTGRTADKRTSGPQAFLEPWSFVGTQTMYCTDCHGSDNGSAENVIPDDSRTWGAHGSNRAFMLKGEWLRGSFKASSGSNFLCFKCHARIAYLGRELPYSGWEDHTWPAHENQYECMWCHAASQHGWKNKAFLVNLEDIGPEVMCRTVDTLPESQNGYDIRVPGGGTCTVGQPIPAGSRVGADVADGIGYNNPPYYVNSHLRLRNFASSGTWEKNDCGTGLENHENSMCGGPLY